MKTYEVVLSPGARTDLYDLEDYIASKSSPEIASRYIDGLLDKCHSLWIAPQRATRRRGLPANLRIIGHERAVTILFRIEEAEQLVVILGTAYRGRTIAYILERNE